MKKQHADQIARSLSPDEQPENGFQGDISGSISPSRYESPYAQITPQVPAKGAPETPHVYPSMPSSADIRTSPSRTYHGILLGEQMKQRYFASRVASARHARREARIPHYQAVIASIWDRDADTLTRIIGRHDYDIEFGDAATSRLVEKLMQDSTISQRLESREAVTSLSLTGDLTGFMRVLTPMRLAILIGFLEGVICLARSAMLSQQLRLMPWLRYAVALYGKSPQGATIAAIAAFVSHNNRGTRPDSDNPRVSFAPGLLSSVRNELASCCPGPKNDMPGGTKWLEHALRRGNTAGACILLERGADPNAVLADGTSLVIFALADGQDKIAVLLLYPRLATGVSDAPYTPKVLIEKTDGGFSDLARLKQAANAMKKEEYKYGRMWRSWLQGFIDTIVWAEATYM